MHCADCDVHSLSVKQTNYALNNESYNLLVIKIFFFFNRLQILKEE